jgi:DNA-binding transcriptional regulator LsrR (DeoR family)
MTGSKEFLAHRAYILYHERNFTQRQVAQSLEIGLATANKYIYLADEDAEEQNDLANLFKGKPFFCSTT